MGLAERSEFGEMDRRSRGVNQARQRDAGSQKDAPGSPGISPTWTSSAKDVVGCSLGPARLWFTIGYGIVNEVYWPRVDIPQVRDLGFIVSDGHGFWSEVKRCGKYSLKSIAPGTPAFEIIHPDDRYCLRLRVSPDPRRDVLAIEVTLESRTPEMRVYVLLAPHLGASGSDNLAGVAWHNGRSVLWADRASFSLALTAVDEDQRGAVRRASAGYVGYSDGWQDFARHGAMTWKFPSAGPGNVALMAELSSRCVLALGFGSSVEAATTLALSSLMQPFDRLLGGQLSDWAAWHRCCDDRCNCSRPIPADLNDQFVASKVVLRSHLDKTYPGAMVASLSVPWGDSGEERGGYFLVWPRDLVQCATALLGIGGEEEARDTLRYLIATQNADGHWNQNQWLDGRSFWRGVQLDEAAFPVLLAAALAERDAVAGTEVADMVRHALVFIARQGPATEQDRWEENTGINAFTLAVCISALVAGSALLNGQEAQWAIELADFWNENIERWTLASQTAIGGQAGVSSHYVRTAPVGVLQLGQAALVEPIPVRNRADGMRLPAREQVSTDFLQLVRLGLRDPQDPLVRSTIAVVDHLLKVETPAGPVWRRYSQDGYGEHEDGSPYDGTGLGRPWPLLAGERGHVELVAGQDPLSFLRTMAASASPGGMIPEQVWDGAPVRERRLRLGRPTGSAMPLAWAHAEFVKLLLSRDLGRPFDRPAAVWNRYKGVRPVARSAFWWLHARINSFPNGRSLVIALTQRGAVRYGIDGWRVMGEVPAEDSGLGFFAARLDTTTLASGQQLEFTIRWDTGEWIGQDFSIRVEP
jgi:glucoamylase